MKLLSKTLRTAVLPAAVFIAAVCAAPPAFAHAFLKKSVPAAGSTVSPAPKFLLLSFTENLEIAFCTVDVRFGKASGGKASGGKAMRDSAAKAQPVPGHPDELRIPLAITTAGKVTVTWHALSTDTHKTKGSFSFTVSP